MVVEWIWVQWVSNMKDFIKKNSQIVAILVMAVLFFLMSSSYEATLTERNKQLKQTELLLEAVNDKMDSITVENGKLSYSKRTLQADVKQLKDMEHLLTDEQNKLMSKVNKANKEKQVIAAALVKTQAELTKIKGKTGFKNDTTLALYMYTDSLSYEIEVSGVALSKDSAKHEIVSLKIPNEMYIDFKWGTKKEGYPVSFSITNSSPYMKTYNIESYIIPEIEKEKLKPSFTQKVDNFFRDNKKPFMIGFGVGAAAVLLIK
jgi:hypothetical protein